MWNCEMIFLILYLTSTWALKGASFLFLWHDIWIIIFHCLDETRSTTQNPNYWSIQKNSLWCSSDDALLLKMKTLEAAPPPKKKELPLMKATNVACLARHPSHRATRWHRCCTYKNLGRLNMKHRRKLSWPFGRWRLAHTRPTSHDSSP
jgi:hypothetical protein